MYVTYNLTPWQTPTDKPLPPQQLHLSNLVMYVHHQAKEDGASFAVIAPYPHGLVVGYNPDPAGATESTLPYDPIPTDIPRLQEKVDEQIKKGISSIDLWVMPSDYRNIKHPVRIYEMVLQEACKKNNVPFNIREVTEPLGSLEKGSITPKVPTPVPPKNVEIGGPYPMNKKAGPTFILRAQDENGIWKNVRKSSFLPDLQIKARMLVKKFPNQKVEIVEAPRDERHSF